MQIHYFGILPKVVDIVIPAIIMVISVISYSNKNTKTDENCYIGFPAIWNVVVLYLVILNCDILINTGVLIFLIILKIIPLRFVHPFRTEKFKKLTLIMSFSWFAFTSLTITIREYGYLSDYYEYCLFSWLLLSFYYIFITLFLNSDKFVEMYKCVKFYTSSKVLSYENNLSAEKL